MGCGARAKRKGRATIGAGSIDTNKKERQYEAKYRGLDNAEGVRILLQDYNALVERQYLGDYDAVLILADLETAIKKAGLTDKQAEVLRLIYSEDLTQKEAAESLSVSQQAIGRHIALLETKIARVYEAWARRGEGYSLSEKEELVS